MQNDSLARQKARAVGKITTGLLLSDPSEKDLQIINELSDATVKRRIKENFFPGGNGLVKSIIGKHPEPLVSFHEGWVEFYKNFGIEIDLAKFPLPENLKLETEKTYWSILVPDVMNPVKSFEIRKQISKTYENISVSKIVDIYPRVKVSVIEAVQNARTLLPNVSCQQSIEMGIFGTTFTEGTLIDGRILKENGMQLDSDGWSLHTGSRNDSGRVPYSFWYDDYEFYVFYCGVRDAGPGLSLRQKQF